MKGSVYPKGSGWILSLYLPYLTKKYWKPYFAKQEDAVREWLGCQRGIDNGTYYPPNYRKDPDNVLLFQNYYDEFVRMKLKAGQKRTARNYEYAKPHFKELFGLVLSEVDRIVIKRFQENLTKDIQATTRNRLMAYLHAILVEAWRDGKIDILPPFPKREKEARKEKRWLSRDEQLMILDCVRPEYKPILAFMMIYGVRRIDAERLQWKDFDFKKNLVALNIVKSNQVNVLPLVKEFTDYLPPIPIDQKGKVFGHSNQSSLIRNLKEACGKAGIGEVTIHEFGPHSWVTQKKDLGFTYEQIGKTIKKTTRVMEGHYDHANLDLKRRLIESG